MKLNKLSPEEKRIIEDKGTEPPFSGEYNDFSSEGVYVCRRCSTPLYKSNDKFSSHCGWPSFDQEIAGAVKRIIDSDGIRTEIQCARCGAHLGHVFEGEKFTPKDTRHCVNSLSIKFIPKEKLGNTDETAYFGGGCFWCLDALFRKIKGVLSVESGYAGGNFENPTYEQVSSGKTGHAEIVKVTFDATKISYEMLLNVFFATHDPTTLNRQGADVGIQYRSIILYENDLQKEIAQKFVDRLEKEKIFEKPIVTEIKKFEKFYPAEEYHQNYFAKNPSVAYCQAVINPKISKLRKNFEYLIDDVK